MRPLDISVAIRSAGPTLLYIEVDGVRGGSRRIFGGQDYRCCFWTKSASNANAKLVGELRASRTMFQLQVRGVISLWEKGGTGALQT